jgi:hypothetical protein
MNGGGGGGLALRSFVPEVVENRVNTLLFSPMGQMQLSLCWLEAGARVQTT